MEIVKVKLYKLGLKLISPFITGFGRIDVKETLIVELTDAEGRVGYGECASLHAPIFNEESVDTCFIVIKNYLTPLILNKKYDKVEDIVENFDEIVGNNIAKAGVEFALWDIYSQLSGISLKKLFGGTKKKIQIGANSIGIQDTPEIVLNKIDQELSKGLERIKLKIKPGNDIRLLDTIRARYPNITLMVDANASYNLNAHIDLLKKMDRYGLVMIEQPFKANTIVDHSILQKQIKTAVCLDESIKDVLSTSDAIKIKACKIVNIKPARIGGVVKTKEINNMLLKNSIKTWCGGMLETSIGRAYNILLSSLNNFDYPADISPVDHYFQDIVNYEPFPIIDGQIVVPDRVGLGVDIDKDLLSRYTVEAYMSE